jgi:hypothetical protein
VSLVNQSTSLVQALNILCVVEASVSVRMDITKKMEFVKQSLGNLLKKKNIVAQADLSVEDVSVKIINFTVLT